MDLAKSQKIVKVLGILDIIAAVLSLIAAIGMMGIGGAGAAQPEFLNDTDVQQGVGALIGIGIVLLVTGVISLLEGVFSLRAAKDASKVKPLWIFSILGMISGAVSLIGSFGSDGQSIANAVFSFALSVFTFYLANNIKKLGA